MSSIRYIKISEVPESAQFIVDSQDIDPLRDYVPNGKDLSAAFVTIANGDYVTIWAMYNGETVPYLDRLVRVINVASYIQHKINARKYAASKRNAAKMPESKPIKTHYIAMAGLRGFMPNYCEVYSSRGSAIRSLIEIHDLDNEADQDLITELRESGWCDLDFYIHGNEYAEIQDCTCDDPAQHSESGWYEDNE